MIFILGVIVGILLALSTVFISLYLDTRGKSVVKLIQQHIPKETGHIIKDEQSIERLVNTFTKSEKL